MASGAVLRAPQAAVSSAAFHIRYEASSWSYSLLQMHAKRRPVTSKLYTHAVAYGRKMAWAFQGLSSHVKSLPMAPSDRLNSPERSQLACHILLPTYILYLGT